MLTGQVCINQDNMKMLDPSQIEEPEEAPRMNIGDPPEQGAFFPLQIGDKQDPLVWVHQPGTRERLIP